MMMFKIVVLPSDALFILLLLSAAGLGIAAWCSEPLRAAWRKVGQNHIGMASATLLVLLTLVAFLDSLHYRPQLTAHQRSKENYSIEVYSVLDKLLVPLKANTEKTYSAPLAIRSFARDSAADGSSRDFPRLQYGGAQLGDAVEKHSADIRQRALGGAFAGFILWLLLAGLLYLCLRKSSLAWRSALAVMLAVMLAGGATIFLAQGYHVLGTDKVGQDVLYLVFKSIRTGLLLGTLTTIITLPAAILLGILAGYVGGWVDDVIQYLYTTLNSIPDVLLIAAAVLMMQVVIDTHPGWFSSVAERADARLLALCIIMGVTSWTGLCRLLRGETLKLRELEYVQAAQAFGVSRLNVMLRHILPNLTHIVLITVVMDFSRLVLAEAVLSYVGVGVDPSTISFGTMIDAARMELAREPMVWWSLAAAFGFMFMLVLAANLFADAVRDAFDPKSADAK